MKTLLLISVLFLIYTTATTLAMSTKEKLRLEALKASLRRSSSLGQVNMTDSELQTLQNLLTQQNTNYSAYQKTEIEYPCGPLAKSPSVPTSVHRLRPGDINVIGAMGDSLSAGTGIAAESIFEDLIQYRGLTWSGGGETDYDDQITLPNILKKYNPEVYGYATGNGDQNSDQAFFNVAVSGSTSSDLADQARRLVDRMKTDPRVDVDNDWKVVTILSGNNDLCDYCTQRDVYNVDNFRASIMAALDILHAELPRTLVNLVEPINVEMVMELNRGLLCATLHRYLCKCAAFPDSVEAAREVVLEADRYQVAVQDIASSGSYHTRDDFTVVHQPFTNATYLVRTEDGKPDMTYFAPDCFHLSRRGQAAAASALWNNMVEPVGQKSIAWSPGQPIQCPSEAQPYFFTHQNSQMGYQAGQQDNGSVSQPAVIAAVVSVCVVVVVIAVVVFIVLIRPRLRSNNYIVF